MDNYSSSTVLNNKWARSDSGITLYRLLSGEDLLGSPEAINLFQ